MTTYSYTVNGKNFRSMKSVNKVISQMVELPEVIKYETYKNGKESSRKIKVKKGRNGFTIS